MIQEFHYRLTWRAGDTFGFLGCDGVLREDLSRPATRMRGAGPELAALLRSLRPEGTSAQGLLEAPRRLSRERALVFLVSDGGAHLDDDTQRRIAEAARRHRVSLYWIYIRSANSPGLLPGKDVSEELAATVPEHFLHEFFGRMGTPYRAYEAEDPEAMKRAIADVSRLESIRYFETSTRRCPTSNSPSRPTATHCAPNPDATRRATTWSARCACCPKAAALARAAGRRPCRPNAPSPP